MPLIFSLSLGWLRFSIFHYWRLTTMNGIKARYESEASPPPPRPDISCPRLGCCVSWSRDVCKRRWMHPLLLLDTVHSSFRQSGLIIKAIRLLHHSSLSRDLLLLCALLHEGRAYTCNPDLMKPAFIPHLFHGQSIAPLSSLISAYYQRVQKALCGII